MNTMNVTSGEVPISWSARGEQRVVQNVQNLMNITRYEVAFDRTLGMPASLVDRPATELVNSMEAQVVDLIERNEPRARVMGVSVVAEGVDGHLQFEVVIENAG